MTQTLFVNYQLLTEICKFRFPLAGPEATRQINLPHKLSSFVESPVY